MPPQVKPFWWTNDAWKSQLRPWNKIFFPNSRIVLVHPKFPDPSAKELHFRVPPSMSKHDIGDVLRSVYGFDVSSIHTAIYAPKSKVGFAPGSGGALAPRAKYRTPSFKKAVVTLR